MSNSRLSRQGSILALLIGTGLLAAYPVHAQNNSALDKNGSPIRIGKKTFVSFEGKPVQVLADVEDTFFNELLVARVYDQADATLGATLQPIGDALRAQLDLPAGQGLLVASLRDDSPSAQAGLRQYDILLSLADKPLAAAEDLTKQLRAAGESAVPLKMLRAGKPVTIPVRPIYRVTLGPVAEPKTEYYIGVSIELADDALRTQLGLPAGQGVVVTDVVAGSPAEKSGVKKQDIVLELAEKPIDGLETLARLVQATQQTPTTLKLLRGGKPVTIPITGAVRKVEASPSQDGEAIRYWYWLVTQQQPEYLATRVNVNNLLTRAGSEDLRPRLDQLEKELKALREAVEKLNETLKAGRATKRD
jgi:C-terminal processing protease CtpA/Prc